MLIAGIDPGAKGGYAELDERGTLVLALPLAEGLDRLVGRLSQPTHVFIEKAQVMVRPGRGAGTVSMFNYGMGFGEIKGVLRCLRIPYQLVTASTWTRAMHAGTTDDHQAKARSIQAARRLFPTHDFIRPRCRVTHDGMVEAALLAEYGRRILLTRPNAMN